MRQSSLSKNYAFGFTAFSRDVAVKVLPSTFSTDADRLNRFQQEALRRGRA
jgi:hypothetical protein